MRKNTLRPAFNLVLFLATVVVNGLANILPINGQNTGEISDRFQVLFVPAGYVFSIWGLIYLGLLAFAIYQALPRQAEDAQIKRIGYWFALSCIANGVWILLWHYNLFPLSLVAMLTLLVSLIVIYLRLDIGHRRATTAEKWLVHTPFSIYLGWITVATIANVTDVLWYLGWNGGGLSPQTWAIIMLCVAAAITLLVNWTRGDVAYVLVIVWAFAGIAVKQADTRPVALAATLLAVIVALPLVITVPRLRRLRAG